MQKGGFYNTGAVGASFTVFNVIYIFGLIGYYATSLSFTQDIPANSILGIFLIWSTLKPLVPLFSAIWGALQITNIVLAFLLVVIIGGIWVGTIGLLSKLLFDFATTCNTPKDFNNICNDLRYCCVFFAEVPSCAGLGPCPGMDNPQTPSDLNVNSDFTLLVIFTSFFFVIELILILLSFGTYNARAKAKKNRQMLYNNFTSEAFSDPQKITPLNTVSVNGTIDEKIDENKHNNKGQSSVSPPTLPSHRPPPSWFNLLQYIDDAIDGLIPHISGRDSMGNIIAIYARRYYEADSGGGDNTKINNKQRRHRRKIKKQQQQHDKERQKKEPPYHQNSPSPPYNYQLQQPRNITSPYPQSYLNQKPTGINHPNNVYSNTQRSNPVNKQILSSSLQQQQPIPLNNIDTETPIPSINDLFGNGGSGGLQNNPRVYQRKKT